MKTQQLSVGLWKIIIHGCSNDNNPFRAIMGNSLQIASRALNSPLTTEQLTTLCAHSDLGELSGTVKQLLSDIVPNNFSYDDILKVLAQFTDKTCVVLPPWTLNLQRVWTSAMCFLKTWPILSEEELADPGFYPNCV